MIVITKATDEKAIFRKGGDKEWKKLMVIAVALVLLLTMTVSVPIAAQSPEPPERAPAYCKVTSGGEGWLKYKFIDNFFWHVPFLTIYPHLLVPFF